MADSCNNCFFFIGGRFCKAAAPLNSRPVNDPSFLWPEVLPTDWCGAGIDNDTRLPFTTAIRNTYRYFRLNITDQWTGGVSTALSSFRLSPDGGNTWYPKQPMTANNLPVPLVASASSESAAQAFNAFALNPAAGWFSSVGLPQWIQIDLGAGNAITPNLLRYSVPLQSPPVPDCTLKAYTLLGSNTGAFAGEEDLLLSVAAASDEFVGNMVTHTVP